MAEQGFERYKTTFWVAAGLVTLWGLTGLVDVGNVPFGGYFTDGNNTVTRIFPDSPAERAGLMVGDYIRSIGGIPVEDSRALARRPRPAIGETRTLVVERGETVLAATPGSPATVNINLTYSGLSRKFVALTFASTLIGACFLAFGLVAYLKTMNLSATLLALLGLCWGIAFFPDPYYASFGLRTLADSVAIVIILLGFAFLLHLLMAFPKAKATLEKKNTRRVIYGPAALMALFVLFLIIVQPAGTSGLNTSVNVLFGIFLVGYFGASLAALGHSYAKATPQERADSGLNVLLASVAVALLPITISSLVNLFAPRVVLPASEFYFLTLVLIPIALATAIVRQEATPAPA